MHIIPFLSLYFISPVYPMSYFFITFVFVLPILMSLFFLLHYFAFHFPFSVDGQKKVCQYFSFTMS